MIVACMSTYREGHLLTQAVRSALTGCDRVLLMEGPVGDAFDDRGDESPLHDVELEHDTDLLHIVENVSPLASDAVKRTKLLNYAKSLAPDLEPLWVLWLDGDEVLLWPEMLRDHCLRADLEPAGAGGFGLRIVELDGSVAMSYGKIIRAGFVRKYLESSYQVELHTGMIVALPNVPICGAGGIPIQPAQGVHSADEQNVWLARCRPPLAGEPHLLHRSSMRHPDRTGRLHDAEADWFPAALEAAGLTGVDQAPSPIAVPDRTVILPGDEGFGA